MAPPLSRIWSGFLNMDYKVIQDLAPLSSLPNFSLPIPHMPCRGQTRFISASATYILLSHERSQRAGRDFQVFCPIFHFELHSNPCLPHLHTFYVYLGLSLQVTFSRKPFLTTEVCFCFLSILHFPLQTISHTML